MLKGLHVPRGLASALVGGPSRPHPTPVSSAALAHPSYTSLAHLFCPSSGAKPRRRAAPCLPTRRRPSRLYLCQQLRLAPRALEASATASPQHRWHPTLACDGACPRIYIEEGGAHARHGEAGLGSAPPGPASTVVSSRPPAPATRRLLASSTTMDPTKPSSASPAPCIPPLSAAIGFGGTLWLSQRFSLSSLSLSNVDTL